MVGGGYAPVGMIPPVPPAPSLLTSADTLPADLDWRSGINWASFCQDSTVQGYCSGGTTRDTPNAGTRWNMLPTTIYTPLLCDRFAGEANLAELPAAAQALTATHTAAGLASMLWKDTGLPAADTSIPSLRRVAWDTYTGVHTTPLDLDDGVASLLAHYELASGGEGGALIHMPSSLAVYALGGGAGGARICWPEGNVYRGPLGSLVVPGPGYPLGNSATGVNGNGPGDAGASPSYLGNSNTTSWIYVSGPVEYAVSDVRVVPEEEMARTQLFTNRYEVWGERDAIVRFDPCKVFAVLVANPAPLPEVS